MQGVIWIRLGYGYRNLNLAIGLNDDIHQLLKRRANFGSEAF